MIKNKIRKRPSKELIWIKKAMNKFPQKVTDYRAGKNKDEILRFLKIHVSILSEGKADIKAAELFLLMELNHKGIRSYSSEKIKVAKWIRKEIMI